MVECWICGKEATRTLAQERDGYVWAEKGITTKSICYCESCYKKQHKTELEEREMLVTLRKREMFRKACRKLEAQDTDMYEYREAIKVVEDHITKHPDKYDSSYEVLAAIVLVHNRIQVKMQYKIKEYQVDCLLPEYSLVLEINGDRHEHRKGYDSLRTESILKALGPGWSVMRVKTDDLDKNAKKLPEAIDKFLDYKESGHINWRKL